MLIEWLKLGKVGFPNRTGKNFLRVWVKHLILAIGSYPEKREYDLKTLPLRSKVWSSFNRWLQFQIKFINPRDWARSPVILAVAGGYSIKTNLDGLKFDVNQKAIADKLAKKYLEGFRGFQHEEYQNWILKVLACLRAAEQMTGASIVNGINSVAEIGPGMASMAGISDAYSSPNFYSYDTCEMQIVQRYVAKSLGIPESRCTYFPVNSENLASKARIPDPPYVLFAFWSFTEVNIFERAYYFDLIQNSSIAVIACNNSFEEVNNFEFLEELALDLGKKIKYTDFLTIFGSSLPSWQQKHRLYIMMNLEA
jgi:hypothetical protein